MVAYNSQPGVIIVRTQAAKGIIEPDMATMGVAVKLRSGSMVGSRTLHVPDPEIGGIRDIPDALLGTAKFAGDYSMYSRMDSLTTFLRAALGSAASVTATGITTHTITPTDALLPMLSIYERISTGLERSTYTDGSVNTFHMEAEADGYVMSQASLIGAKQVAGVADIPASALWDNSSLAMGTQVTATYGGVALPAKSFKLDIANNFEDSDFRLGSFYVGDLTPKRRSIKASFGLRHDDNTRMRQSLFGTSVATEAGGITTKLPLVITITSADNIVGGTPAGPSSLTMTFPKVVFEPFAFQPSGDDSLAGDVSMQVIRPDPVTPIMTAVIKTGRALIA